MSSNGNLCILTDFNYIEEEVTTGMLFKKTEQVGYIKTLTIDGKTVYEFNYEKTLKRITTTVNTLVEARNRYLRMQRDLHKHGCVIRRK